MKYIWNVAKHSGYSVYNAKRNPTYTHHCRIEHDEVTEEGQAAFLAQLRIAFPKGEYDITLMRWINSGTEINLHEPDGRYPAIPLTDTHKLIKSTEE